MHDTRDSFDHDRDAGQDQATNPNQPSDKDKRQTDRQRDRERPRVACSHEARLSECCHSPCSICLTVNHDRNKPIMKMRLFLSIDLYQQQFCPVPFFIILHNKVFLTYSTKYINVNSSSTLVDTCTTTYHHFLIEN